MDKGNQIKVDLYSRPNAINGKYRVGKLGLDNVGEIKSKDTFFLETLKIKADLADKMIVEAESQGKNTSEFKVMEKLGEEINSVGTPIHKNESIMSAIFVSLQLTIYYGIAIGIWGLFFKKSFLAFGLWGVTVGFLISLLSVAPVIAFQRTREKVRDMSFAAGALWGNIAIIIGALGLITLIIRSVF